MHPWGQNETDLSWWTRDAEFRTGIFEEKGQSPFLFLEIDGDILLISTINCLTGSAKGLCRNGQNRLSGNWGLSAGCHREKEMPGSESSARVRYSGT